MEEREFTVHMKLTVQDAPWDSQSLSKRIPYGNTTTRQTGEDFSVRTDWMFEAVPDYGQPNQ